MTVKSRTALFILSLAIVVASPVHSFAQAASSTAPASRPSKVAFVNVQQAVISCNEGKQEAAVLQQRFSAKQTALKTQDDELKKLKDDLQVAGDKLNEEERNSRARAIQDKQKAFERSYADYQAETQEAQQEAVNKIMKKMMPVLEKYLVDHGFTAAIDVSNPQIPVIWASKDSLITQELVDAYNAQGSGASAAAPVHKPAGSTATPKR